MQQEPVNMAAAPCGQWREIQIHITAVRTGKYGYLSRRSLAGNSNSNKSTECGQWREIQIQLNAVRTGLQSVAGNLN